MINKKRKSIKSFIRFAALFCAAFVMAASISVILSPIEAAASELNYIHDDAKAGVPTSLVQEFDFDEMEYAKRTDKPAWILDKINLYKCYEYNYNTREEWGDWIIGAEGFNEYGGEITNSAGGGYKSYIEAPGAVITSSEELIFITINEDYEKSYGGYYGPGMISVVVPEYQSKNSGEEGYTEQNERITIGTQISHRGRNAFSHNCGLVVPEPQIGQSLKISLYTAYWAVDFYYTVPEPQAILQEDVTEAEENSGEDEGTLIDSDIAEGVTPMQWPAEDSGDTRETGAPAGAVAAAAGAIAAAGVGAAMSGGGESKERGAGGNEPPKEQEREPEPKKRSRYKMYVNKDFGNTLKKREEPKAVYARIVEITPEGWEKERDDLSRRIEVSSGDNALKVEDGGFTVNGYKAALVSVPENCEMNEGSVTFTFNGEGGVYTRHVVFNIAEARICFLEEELNKGLPAHCREEIEIAFSVIGMDKNADISAEIIPDKGLKAAYEVSIKPCEEVEADNLYYACVKDILTTDNEEAGTTHLHTLRITAVTDKETITGELSIHRIHTGLTLLLEGNALGCYLKPKEYRNEMAAIRAVGSEMSDNMSVTGLMSLNPMATMLAAGFEGAQTASLALSGKATNLRENDLEPCVTEGRLLLLYWNEEKKELERVTVIPDNKKPCKVRALSVGNTKMSHTGQADENHQRMAESLEICAFGTDDVNREGRKIKLCATRAALDPPTRLWAEVTVHVTYREEEYEITKKLLLHSLPFRKFSEMSFEEANRVLKWDEHVMDMLISIKNRIFDSYMQNLFSLYNLIERMLDGYDENFGYDVNQINNVMEIWTGFLKGEKLGARGDSYKISLADELNAAYAFLEGLRDNGGILGRIALGVCTAGYSEHVFFAMDMGEKMKEAVFACKGDEEFGFWDGVSLGAKEYIKSELTGLLIGGAAKLGNAGGSALLGKVLKKDVNIGDSIFKGYRSLMDSADEALKKNSKAYKGTAEALEKIGVCTNASARAAGNAAKHESDLNEAANQRAETTIAERRAGKGSRRMTPEEIKDMEIADKARSRGMDKINEFNKARKKVGKSRREGGDFWGAKKEMEEKALEIWKDKNAMKALKSLEGAEGADIRMTFNTYRNGIQDSMMKDALDDVASELGKTRGNLYITNATSNSHYDELSGKSTPEDLDVTMTEINYSDRSKESIYMVIDTDVANNAMARNLYKRIYGFEPPSIEEALRLMEKLDITYVQPMRLRGQHIDVNPEAYLDLEGMIDKAGHTRSLKALGMNRYTFAHKGNHWYKEGDMLISQARALEAQAESAMGAARTQLLDEATDLRIEAHGYFVEGTRQITKQTDKISIPRNAYRISKGMQDAFNANSREIHALAKRVGKDLSPAEFFHILRSDYGIDKYAYSKLMSECLV